LNDDVLPGDDGIHRRLEDALPFELAIIDRSGRIRWSNAAWSRLTEHAFGDASSSLLSNYFDLFYSVIYNRTGQRKFSNIIDFVKMYESRVSINYTLRIRDGRWLHVFLESLHFDGEACLLASHVDITDQKEREEVIRQLADVDGLTALTNRRGLDAFLRTEFNRAQRSRSPVSLLLIDVDYFKKYNDQFGHLAGDDALRTIARTLSRFGRRPTDLVARYGGEEFAIVLGNTDPKGALVIARRVHRSIAALQLPFSNGKDGYVSVSIGVATTYPKQSSVPDDLVSLADEALYSAKKDGRDRVVSCETAQR
jgi:diguanylate cyclase (GGDEF)-like protein